MSTGIPVPSEFFWRTKFFPTSWNAVFSQVWRRSIFKFCVYKLAEAVRYLKFKWEFVIIGRGCLVVLKFKWSLCWQVLCFKALKRLCSFGIQLPCVNPTFLRADSQWIIILKTFELVTANSMFHVSQSVHETALLFLKPDVTKKNREFFFHCLFCYTCYSPPVTSYLT